MTKFGIFDIVKIFIFLTYTLWWYLALVTTFNVEIGITGAILTKLDGDSRGGAALSVKEVRHLNFHSQGRIKCM